MTDELFQNIETIQCEWKESININTEVIQNKEVLQLEIANHYSYSAFLNPDQVDSLIQKLIDIRRQWPQQKEGK